jgi:prepilin-type N-terminal cleavage/methylation domain-containing protein
MKIMKTRTGGARGQEGFTLIEAIMATAILVVGLAAVSNLIFVAISSNTLGNRMTTASFLASQKMEQLRSIPFDDPAMVDSAANSLQVDQALFNEDNTVERVGNFHTRWNITTVGAFGASLKYLAVQTEFIGPLGRQTRAEFTTYRACTLTGCNP